MTDKTQHTPEPWTYKVTKKHDKIVATAPNGSIIVQTGTLYDDDCGNPECCKREEHANAKRIVECVNALAGIANPAEWVEKQKQLDQWNLALIKSINEIRTENEQLKKTITAKTVEWQQAKEIAEGVGHKNSSLVAENEELKKRLAEFTAASTIGESIVEPEQVFIKPEDMKKREWYWHSGIRQPWVFKFKEIKDNAVIVFKSCASDGDKYERVIKQCFLHELRNLRPATRSEVLKYFPDEQFD